MFLSLDQMIHSAFNVIAVLKNYFVVNNSRNKKNYDSNVTLIQQYFGNDLDQRFSNFYHLRST